MGRQGSASLVGGGRTFRPLVASADVVVLLLEPSRLDAVDSALAPDAVADAEIDRPAILSEP